MSGAECKRFKFPADVAELTIYLNDAIDLDPSLAQFLLDLFDSTGNRMAGYQDDQENGTSKGMAGHTLTDSRRRVSI
jgi:hypothetical protein